MSEFLPWAAKRAWVSAVIVALVMLLLAGWCLLDRVPVPQIHDEFAYVLSADTFRHGRLTNPAHPMGRYLQTFHVLMEPTYQAKYPPGSGIAMALGWAVFGHPLLGITLTMMLACVAMWWVLLAVVGRPWALVGAMLFAAQEVSIQWATSYWGGAVALLGGGMVLGAVLRLRKRPGRLNAILLGLGLIILANSRQYEGLVMTMACGVMVMVLDGWRGLLSLLHRSAWAIPLLVLGASWMGYYNYRVTGDVLTSPYVLYERKFATTPALMFLPKPAEKSYELPTFKSYYLGRETRQYNAHFGPGAVSMYSRKVLAVGNMCVQMPAVGVGLLVAVVMGWRDRITRALLLAAGICAMGSLASLWLFWHYLAAMLPLVVAAVARGVRLANLPPAMRWLGPVIAILAVASGGYYLYERVTSESLSTGQLRQSIEEQVSRDSKKHLLMVAYNPSLTRLQIEFVYNSAKVDEQQVVWAHLMDDIQPLLDYYPDRKHWVVDITTDGLVIPFEQWNARPRP